MRSIVGSRSVAALFIVVAAYAAAPAVAQGSSYTTETFGDRPFSPFRPRREGPPPPAIRLRVERSVALLGPLVLAAEWEM